ncbi:Galactosylceramide sulfotransferase [Holothuria leucospilota]|uniref:Galactosylceramide sulfotransferase n=1 Tax=Holothuria leucospilota TaxID=206669 RepID=A0A9Q1CED4_HOLLE|nr:Galactosylceramide sulfotransferase [Holothuria leucospilota]
MARDTKYITIVRDPVDQWLSAVTFFNFKKYLPPRFSNLSTELVAWELANRPKLYKKKMRGNDPYYFQNNQAFDLGLGLGHCHNSSAITKHIKLLDNKMDLVLINEYFDESLLLMKKMFCWSWTDILYISVNQQSRRHAIKNDTLKELVRKNNKADQYIYKHFNKSLWKKIQDYGANFSKDLAFFRRFRENTNKKCVLEDIVVQGRLLHKPQANNLKLCEELVNRNQISQIAEKQTQSGAHINDSKPTVKLSASNIMQMKWAMNKTLRTKPLLKYENNLTDIESTLNQNTSLLSKIIANASKRGMKESLVLQRFLAACRNDLNCKELLT